MKQDDAITYADAAAGVVGSSQQPVLSFSKMLKLAPADLAQFLDANPEVDAEALYLFSRRCAGKASIKPWANVSARTRCAFEVYRATYAVLMRMARADELAAREAERGKLTGDRVVRMGERTFSDRTPGHHDRVKLR